MADLVTDFQNYQPNTAGAIIEGRFGVEFAIATYSLGERTALADGDPVTLLNTESGGNVSGQVLVALLVTVVLGNVVEVFTADDDGAVHLGGHNTAGQDTATNGDKTGEGALLVCDQSVSGLIDSTGTWRFKQDLQYCGSSPRGRKMRLRQATENREKRSSATSSSQIPDAIRIAFHEPVTLPWPLAVPISTLIR